MPLESADYDELASSPAAASGDMGSVTARSADDVIKLDDRARAVDAVVDQNVNGGPKSAWHCLRPARVQLPGAR